MTSQGPVAIIFICLAWKLETPLFLPIIFTNSSITTEASEFDSNETLDHIYVCTVVMVYAVNGRQYSGYTVCIEENLCQRYLSEKTVHIL